MSFTSDSEGVTRCDWAVGSPLMIEYHDRDWGVPLHDDSALFELLTLEGAQAGLSWVLILKRIDGYREVFHQFDIETVASFTPRDMEALLASPLIIRNRAKIEATVNNAGAVLDVIAELGSFDNYIWSFVDGRAVQNSFTSLSDLPVETPVSRSMSNDLKRRGFKFVGPTICYSFMQSAGLVNDHLVGCFRHAQLQSLSNA